MSAPSSMCSSRPPAAELEDVLSAEECEIIRKMRAKKEARLRAALQKREHADRLEALRAEIAKLAAEEEP